MWLCQYASQNGHVKHTFIKMLCFEREISIPQKEGCKVGCGKGGMLLRGLYNFDQYWGSYQGDPISSCIVTEI